MRDFSRGPGGPKLHPLAVIGTIVSDDGITLIAKRPLQLGAANKTAQTMID